MHFHIPVLPGVLPRPRLNRLLEQNRHCRIVLVTGQAAQGKSTLVADHLGQDPTPSLWFHLTQAASDAGILFDLLVRGLAQGSQAMAPSPSFPHVSLGTRQDLPRQAERILAALDQGRPLNLVLDDMESLDPEAPAWALIQELVSYGPARVRFFLLSRTRPPLNLSRFKMKKELLELANQDLAFTLEETLAFFRGTDNAGTMAEETAQKILTTTSGWAGGLVLILEAVRHTPGLRQLPDQLSSEAFSYFSQEIFNGLDKGLRRFLRQTALFEELDTRILSLVFADTDPLAIFTRLEQRNLFIQKIIPDTLWPVFKYNNLFREFLLADLTRTGSDLVSLNQKIGLVYWDQMDHEKAIPFFMAAKDHEQVARILRIKGADYVITGRADRLVGWIDALPGHLIQDDPWLIFFRTMAGRIKGGKKNMAAFNRALSLFRKAGQTRGILLSLAYLIEAAVFTRQPSQVIRSYLQAGETALADLGGQYRFTWARTLLWQQIGLGYIAGTGEIPRGISACRNAIMLAQGIDNPGLILNASVILTLGLVGSGDFTQAREMLARTRQMAQEDRQPEYRALETITNIDLALKRGDLEQAGALLARSEADIEKFGLIFLYPGLVEARALYHASMGQFEQALQGADHLSDVSLLEGHDFYQGISRRIKAVALLLKGDALEAAVQARQAVADLDRSQRGESHLYLARQVLGLALFRLGDLEGCYRELSPVLVYFKGMGSDLSFCETAFILGLASLQAGKPLEEGAALLAAALEKGLDNRYTYFPLLCPDQVGQALVRACQVLPDPDALLIPYVKACNRPGILAAVQAALAGEGKAPGFGALFRFSCPRLFITTLGPFSVTRGNTPLPLSAFGGGRPLMLLKILLLKGGIDVPKEILMDALWPEAGEAAGEKNLKVNLHRVRKAMEPDLPKAFGHVYLIQKGGRVSLDPDLVSWDTRQFDTLSVQGRTLEAARDAEGALACYIRAIRLYQGDFFRDDPYLEGTEEIREMYRRGCLDLMMRKASIHQTLGQWQAAVETLNQVLEMDGCQEKACRQLMRLYGEAGLRIEASKAFFRCRDALEKELDTEPEALTLEVFEAVAMQGHCPQA